MGEEEKKGEEGGAAKEAAEKKEGGGGGGGGGDQKKENGEEAQPQPQEIVLKVDMHCEACARKVARSLKGFQGVEDVSVDCKASKVVVKGKAADPIKVSERIRKKSGRKVEILSPLPNPPEPEENKEAPPPPPPQEKKEEPPAVVTVVLNVQMHCEACAQVLEKRIKRIKGVESVETDLGNNEVTVKGVVDAEKLVADVYKRTRKQAIIVKKEEEKKEEPKKEEEEKKKAEEDQKKEGDNKEEAKGGGGGGGGDQEEEGKKVEVKKSEYWPPKNYMEYYANYPPQIFSDENPNACSLM